MLICIVLISLITVGEGVMAAGRIDEVLIIGNTRSYEQVIVNQLPFAVGDVWDDKYKDWLSHRLITLGVFSYESPQVIVEPLEEGRCRVIVRVGDPVVFYREPMEFAITTGIDLASKQFRPVLFNPFGTGHNLSLELDWEHQRYLGRITSPLGSGFSRLLAGKTAYDDQGEWLVQADYANWSSHTLRQQIGLGYSVLDDNNATVTAGLSLYHLGLVTTDVSFRIGQPLTSDPVYWQAQAVTYARTERFVVLARGGYASPETPVRRWFEVGSSSLLPLRAESNSLLAYSYTLGTLEYHHPINPMVSWIAFADGGVLWQEQSKKTVVNVGTGLSINTPVGKVRFDAAINPESKDYRFAVGFGASYRPPQ